MPAGTRKCYAAALRRPGVRAGGELRDDRARHRCPGIVHEIRRVLRARGKLVLSTPNRAFGAPERHARNPFHVREFTADELHDLLSASFEEVQLFGQRPSPAYRYVPFLMIERDLSPAAFSWKLMARLPFSARDLLARAMSGRPFYPGEDDYCFDPDHTEGAHALVALAR